MHKIVTRLGLYFQNHWQLAVLDPQKGLWTVKPTPSNIPYLKAQNLNGRHILMKPLSPSYYLLVDDLSWSIVCRHHRYRDGAWKPGRMVVETSPANFQVWIHSCRPLHLDEKRYWLKILHSDPAADPANRFGRCPGFRNRKEKHRSHDSQYPLAKLIWIDWQAKATIPTAIQTSPQSHTTPFPFTLEGSVCLQTPVSRHHFDCGDESRTDFSYVLALLCRRFTDEQIRDRILSERTCWANHQGNKRIDDYLNRTIKNAKIIVQNNARPKNAK